MNQDQRFEESLDGNIKSTLGCLGVNVFFFIVLGIPLDRLNLLILLWDGGQTWLASSGMKQRNLAKVEKAFMMMMAFFILLFISMLRDIRESLWRRSSSNWPFYFHLFRISIFAIGYFYPLIKTRSTLRANREQRNENEDGHFERNENGEETSVYLKKLDSSTYVIYQYWMLISALWTLKPDFDEDENDLPEIKDYLTFFIIWMANSGLAILNIWHVVNCGLVFEGMRRKSLQLIQYSLQSMDLYSIAFMALYFFAFTNKTLRDFFEKRSRSIGPSFYDLSSMNWTIVIAAGLLVWRIYCQLIYIYGAQKVRDALKAHERLRHRL